MHTMVGVMKTLSQQQSAFLFLLIIMILCGILLYREETIEMDPVEYELIGNQYYIRDHLGYLYPKEYFSVPPGDIKKSLKNVRGQHSDTIMPKCDDPIGADPANTNHKTGWIEPKDYLKNYKNPCWYEPGNVLQCVPYFYLIGMAKSGSTDLFNRILNHPDVAKGTGKEYRWFDSKRFNPDKSYRSHLSYYLGFLKRKTAQIKNKTTEKGFHHMIFGDGSPSYSWDNIHWDHTPENQYCLEPRTIIVSYIHHLFPDAKLILILRNPVDRLYSHYLFHAKRTNANSTAEEFHEWVEQSLNTYKECYKTQPFRQCLYSEEIKNKLKFKPIPSSIYSRLILDILKIFPRDQLLILHMEDYSANVKERLQTVFDFLKLDRLSDSQMDLIAKRKKKNTGKRYATSGRMLNKTRELLTDFFRPFNEELAELMNDNKFLWLPRERD